MEVVGIQKGDKVKYTLPHTHPSSDGSVPGWEKLQAYTRNVGIPLAIATELIAHGQVEKTGVITPEEAFVPEVVFRELKKREICVHTQVQHLEHR